MDALRADGFVAIGPALRAKHPDAIVVSAQSPEDVAMLRETIIAFFEAAIMEDELMLPYAKQSLLAEVYDNARVLSEEYDAEGRMLKVRGLPGTIGHAAEGVAVEPQNSRYRSLAIMRNRRTPSTGE